MTSRLGSRLGSWITDIIMSSVYSAVWRNVCKKACTSLLLITFELATTHITTPSRSYVQKWNGNNINHSRLLIYHKNIQNNDMILTAKKTIWGLNNTKYKVMHAVTYAHNSTLQKKLMPDAHLNFLQSYLYPCTNKRAFIQSLRNWSSDIVASTKSKFCFFVLSKNLYKFPFI